SASSALSAARILELVFIQRVLYVPDPILVGAIPLDGGPEAGGEVDLGGPLPFLADLGAIYRISPVMTRAVLHETDQRFGLYEEPQNCPNDFEVSLIMSAADVVNLARPAAFERQQDRAGVLIGKDPFPDVEAIAIDGQRAVFHRIRDENRNELLGKLIRTVIVRAPRDDRWNTERLVVREGEKIGRCLARRIRAARIQGGILAESAGGTEAAVYFIG